MTDSPVPATVAWDNVCKSCRMPAPGRLCGECRQQRAQYGNLLADRVVVLDYAIRHGTQRTPDPTYEDLKTYKTIPADRPATRRLQTRAMRFRAQHWGCLERLARCPVTKVTSVPSGRGRTWHPLTKIAGSIAAAPVITPSYFIGKVRSGRPTEVTPDDFALSTTATTATHLLIVEDAWVCGYNAQSLAVAAKRQGVREVTIVALGRILDCDIPSLAAQIGGGRSVPPLPACPLQPPEGPVLSEDDGLGCAV